MKVMLMVKAEKMALMAPTMVIEMVVVATTRTMCGYGCNTHNIEVVKVVMGWHSNIDAVTEELLESVRWWCCNSGNGGDGDKGGNHSGLIVVMVMVGEWAMPTIIVGMTTVDIVVVARLWQYSIIGGDNGNNRGGVVRVMTMMVAAW
ncbi:hypothetical protein Ancab_021275 [Ancistrocladus abbreviatus]